MPAPPTLPVIRVVLPHTEACNPTLLQPDCKSMGMKANNNVTLFNEKNYIIFHSLLLCWYYENNIFLKMLRLLSMRPFLAIQIFCIRNSNNKMQNNAT